MMMQKVGYDTHTFLRAIILSHLYYVTDSEKRRKTCDERSIESVHVVVVDFRAHGGATNDVRDDENICGE